MIGSAFAASGSDFVVGLIIACVIALLVVGLSRLAPSSSQVEDEQLPSERIEPMDFAAEIRVRDRSRRGPEFIAGPPERERLPLEGRTR